MTQIIAALENRHPGAEAVLVITGLTRSHLDAMRDGDVDLVVARLPVADSDTGSVLRCVTRPGAGRSASPERRPAALGSTGR
jgi:DNA-binding transcriptional LysR family regulator